MRRSDSAGRPSGDAPSRRLVIVLSIAILVFAAIAGTAWYGKYRADQRNGAVRDATAAAGAAAQAIFSYDYHTFDASINKGKTFVTGSFAKEYAQTTSTLKDAAQKEQAVVRAQVAATGVISAAPDKVELLLYVNQYRKNVNIVGEKVDQNRVTLTMVRVGNDWRVSGATAV